MLTKTHARPEKPIVPDAPSPGTYSPVTVHQEDTVGAIFLGITTLSLLIAFLRAEARNRALLAELTSARAARVEAVRWDGRTGQLQPRQETASPA